MSRIADPILSRASWRIGCVAIALSLWGAFTNVPQVEHCYDDLDENDWFKVDTQAADD